MIAGNGQLRQALWHRGMWLATSPSGIPQRSLATSKDGEARRTTVWPAGWSSRGERVNAVHPEVKLCQYSDGKSQTHLRTVGDIPCLSVVRLRVRCNGSRSRPRVSRHVAMRSSRHSERTDAPIHNGVCLLRSLAKLMHVWSTFRLRAVLEAVSTSSEPCFCCFCCFCCCCCCQI